MAGNGLIAVKERLPEFDEVNNNYLVSKVVLMTDGRYFFTGYFYCRKNGSLNYNSFPEDEYSVTENPTHWQYLPKMPGQSIEVTATCQDRVDIGAKP